MKKVLVTNDDGINAAGLASLAEYLSRTYEVYVAAPAEQQSAKSMAITFQRTVDVHKTSLRGAVEASIVDGTPVDCVKWALSFYCSRGITFDYVFSGINLGANVGIAAYYSGTIGAAREGALNGVRSIAMSVGTHESTHFDYICSLIPRLTAMADTLSPATILSVNAPDLPPWEVRGLRIAEVAPFGYAEEYSFAPAEAADAAIQIEDDSDAENYLGTYQLAQHSLDGKPSAGKSSEIGPGMLSRTGEPVTDADLRYDLDCMRYGYAAITPLSIGNSDEVALRRLQGRYSSDDVLAVFLDVQENPAAGLEQRNRFTANITKLAECMRRLDVPVVVTELYGAGDVAREMREALNQPGSGPDRNNVYSRPSSGRAGNNPQPAVRMENCMRREISAWGSGDFARIMESTSARKVMIAGLETHASVMQTALDFLHRGYEVTIIEDCCASRRGHDHKLAIERLRGAGCTITTSRAAVMELVSTTSHPAAAAIDRIMN